MRKSHEHIKIELRTNVSISIYPLGNCSKIFEVSEEEARTHGECLYQLLEANSYEYILNPKEYQLEASGKAIIPSPSGKHRGILFTGNNVGSLQLNIIGKEHFTYSVEVLATKFDSKDDYDSSYRTNYRYMLSDITEKCTELIMQSNSLVNQYFKPDFTKDNETLYQKFSFIKSILQSDVFEESILKIFSSPKTTRISHQEEVDVRRLKRLTNQNLRDLIGGQRRTPLPRYHPLFRLGKIESIATSIKSSKQKPSLDNPENRFIKHALKEYLQFCENCKSVFASGSRDYSEASYLVSILETYLNHPFFKLVSKPTTLKLNSPTLQRKSGYRQILKSWLMFDLAAKLTWTGGQDVYNAGKRDIATLYEYWLFFVLYDLFKVKFDLKDIHHNDKPYNHLFEKTRHGINLIIKSGHHTALEGSTVIKHRNIKVKFSFNRTFTGKKDSFPTPGSWTMNMRPDYTLSVWPKELEENEAEKTEQIVHIHFDAKYKVNHFNIGSKDKGDQTDLTEKEIEDLNQKEKEERIGKFKNGDLYKMHTYRDAIRRTGGAYILYPGTRNTKYRGFHELIPGLGAFSINPASEKENVSHLSNFIDKVIDLLVNRTSHRENIASKTYEITKDGLSKPLNELIPEYIKGKKLIPSESFVLIGYVKSADQLEWINKTRLYNFRTDTNRGALKLNNKAFNSKFLLLHGEKENSSTKLFTITDNGFRVTKKKTLKRLKYPNPTQDNYLVIKVEPCLNEEFVNKFWNFKELKEYKSGRASAIPFTVSLADFLKCKQNE